MRLDEIIKIEGRYLRYGETVRIVCPLCNGGTTQEKSGMLSNTEGTLRFRCYRASCGARVNAGRADTNPHTKSKPKIKPFYQETFPLSDGMLEWLWSEFYVTPELADKWGWTMTGGEVSLVIPCYNRHSQITGHVVRRRVRASEDQQKVLYYPEQPNENTAWFVSKDGPELILVEDAISAARASEYCDAMSLLGYLLTASMVFAIRQGIYKRIRLVLDADATASAVKQAQRWGAMLPDLQVIRLHDKDLKNMSPNELTSWFDKTGILTSQNEATN